MFALSVLGLMMLLSITNIVMLWRARRWPQVQAQVVNEVSTFTPRHEAVGRQVVDVAYTWNGETFQKRLTRPKVVGAGWSLFGEACDPSIVKLRVNPEAPRKTILEPITMIPSIGALIASATLFGLFYFFTQRP